MIIKLIAEHIFGFPAQVPSFRQKKQYTMYQKFDSTTKRNARMKALNFKKKVWRDGKFTSMKSGK